METVLVYISSFIIGTVLGGAIVFFWRRMAINRQLRAAQRKAARLRLVSVFRRGWIAILVSLIRHEPLPLGCFIPEPWSMPTGKPLQYKRLGVAA